MDMHIKFSKHFISTIEKNMHATKNHFKIVMNAIEDEESADVLVTVGAVAQPSSAQHDYACQRRT